MFLSKLIPNARHRLARRDLANAYELHRSVWSAFPVGDSGRVLFRVDADRTGARPVVLVQSDREPDWSRLPTDGYLLTPPAWKAFDPEFVRGQRLRFRLRANPTKRVHAKNSTLGGVMAGKRVAIVVEAEQIAWLLRKGEAGGFRVPGEWAEGDGRRLPNFRMDVTPEGAVWCGKGGHRDGRFVATRFDGVLEVNDPAAFRKTVEDGVGSGKGFGFGLLSVAPTGGRLAAPAL